MTRGTQKGPLTQSIKNEEIITLLSQENHKFLFILDVEKAKVFVENHNLTSISNFASFISFPWELISNNFSSYQSLP